MDRLFIQLYPKKLFTLAEANKIIKDYQVCRNHLHKLTRQKMIIRLKPGVYYIMPLDNPEFYPDTLHIASKLRDDAVICANSALKTLKLWNKDESTIYIGSRHPSKIRINEYTYKIIKNYTFGIEEIAYSTPYGIFDIKVTDLEHTLIDCLRIRSIKGEELIGIIRTKQLELNFKRLMNYLEKYNMPILYHKVGLILELCKNNLKIDNDDIEKIRKKLTKKIYYFKERGIKLIRPKYHYYKPWNIMLPENLYKLTQPTAPDA